MRVADSLFASLDPDRSLFFQAASSGFVERMPDQQRLDRFAFEPPDDTRAYFRAHVLRRHGDAVSSMDWSRITFRVPVGRHWWSFAEIPMRDPRHFNRAETEALFQECSTLNELVEAANALAQEKRGFASDQVVVSKT
jgi:proteasome accessory factor A